MIIIQPYLVLNSNPLHPILRPILRLVVHTKMSTHSREPSASGLIHDPRPQTSHIHRMSANAPPDAPPMNIRYLHTHCFLRHNFATGCVCVDGRWFYATDVP